MTYPKLLTYRRSCPNCGEHLIGDGYKEVIHCPYADLSLGYEPDANPVYCTDDEQLSEGVESGGEGRGN